MIATAARRGGPDERRNEQVRRPIANPVWLTRLPRRDAVATSASSSVLKPHASGVPGLHYEGLLPTILGIIAFWFSGNDSPSQPSQSPAPTSKHFGTQATVSIADIPWESALCMAVPFIAPIMAPSSCVWHNRKSKGDRFPPSTSGSISAVLSRLFDEFLDDGAFFGGEGDADEREALWGEGESACIVLAANLLHRL